MGFDPRLLTKAYRVGANEAVCEGEELIWPAVDFGLMSFGTLGCGFSGIEARSRRDDVKGRD